MIGEYDGAGALQRRYVFGPGLDEPIVQYEGSGTADRRFLSSDERGSIISITDSSGGVLAINRYDEYGIPSFGALANQRFGYTGQAWLPSAQLWHYKARIYHPVLGRFMQTDPIGYADGLNLYAYVGNDPVNFVDPLGLQGEDIVVCGNCYDFSFGGGAPGGGSAVSPMAAAALALETYMPNPAENGGPPIIVTANRIPRSTTKPPQPPTVILPPTLGAAGDRDGQDWCGNRDVNAPEGSWSQACKAHDLCYSTLGVSKISCDNRLRKDVFRQCYSAMRALATCNLISWSYFIAVLRRGQESFDLGQQEARRRVPGGF